VVVVEIDDRHRITIPKGVRETLNLSEKQKLYMVVAGDTLIIKKMPPNPSESLDEILGDIRFDREARRRAEEWLLSQTRERS
jgi:AbrB family looped-hinge helix DNA binding protein